MKTTIFAFKRTITLALLGSVLFISSCKKDKEPVLDKGPKTTLGVYVLCEGGYDQINESSITYYDVVKNTTDKNYFKTQNGVELGTNANDLKQYGSKLYCVVTGTTPDAKNSYVEVINPVTGKSIKRIQFADATRGFLPRYITFYQNKAYVTGYDGYISKIDTASLTIEARVATGGALDGIAAVNGKLYAANSSHPIFPNGNNSSVSVVDIATFTKLKDINVSINPSKITATATGDVFVITSGQYSPFIASAFEKLSSATDSKTQTYTYNLSALTISGDKGYVITGDYPGVLKTFNIATAAIGANFVTDATTFQNPYGLSVNALDENVFVADATDYTGDGRIFCFDSTGKSKFDFATGKIPRVATFNYGYK